jgi:hypothetical protein
MSIGELLALSVAYSRINMYKTKFLLGKDSPRKNNGERYVINNETKKQLTPKKEIWPQDKDLLK